DFNMLNIRPIGPGRFELQLAPDTRPFHVAIHALGFLQHFESGPFRLTDAKAGILEIPISRPAGLDVRFDSAMSNSEDELFKGALLQVWRQIPGTTDSYLVVATKDTPASNGELKLTDLAPGAYRASVRTYPKREDKSTPSVEINPGAFHDV